MEFLRTAKRAPKGLRTTEVIQVDTEKLKDIGTFAFDSSNSLMLLKFADGTKVVLVLQRTVSYTEKKPVTDALAKYLPIPVDNEDDEGDVSVPPAK